MRPREKHPQDSDDEFRQISHLKATLLRVWGPADSWDNPLAGTKYDPIVAQRRQHEQLEERRSRWEHRKEHWHEMTHRHTEPRPQDQPSDE